MTRGAGQVNTDSRAPSEKPPFTIGTLRKAIPAHCFERSLLRSFAYLGVDLLLVGILFTVSQLIEARAPLWLAAVAWPLYWFFQVGRMPATAVLVQHQTNFFVHALDSIPMVESMLRYLATSVSFHEAGNLHGKSQYERTALRWWSKFTAWNSEAVRAKS